MVCVNEGYIDAEADIPLAEASGAICVQRFDDSRDSAIHITYRSSLRSSSLREPRYPLLRVVLIGVHEARPGTRYLRYLVCGWLIIKRQPMPASHRFEYTKRFQANTDLRLLGHESLLTAPRQETFPSQALRPTGRVHIKGG